MKIPLVFGVLLALWSVPLQAQEVAADHRLIRCIAHIVYGEARDEPIEGQFAVAWSLLFRAAANSPDFGGSDICNVAYRYTPGRWQYDGAKIAVRDMRAWETSVYVAYMTLLGEGRPNVPIMYFCSTQVPGACRWHDRATHYVGQYGGHKFYLDPRFPAIEQASVQY